MASLTLGRKQIFRTCFTPLLWLGLGIFLFALPGHAQERKPDKKEIKLHKAARKYLQEEEYEEAKNVYLELLNIDSTDVDYNYEAGLAFFNSTIDKDQASFFFDRSLRHFEGPPLADLVYYQGRAYQFNGEFDKAIESYKRYRRLSEFPSPGFDQPDVERCIRMCHFGLAYFEDTRSSITIQNLGPNVNSPFPDYAPVIKNDESVLIFTSRREGSTGGRLYLDGKFFEDIYVSTYVNDSWTKATNRDTTNILMNSEVNTPYHEAAISFSKDELTLFIYRENGIWKSQFKEDEWQFPSILDEEINERNTRVPHVFLSDDENTMFVVSDKKGGYGGLDIWLTHRDETGKWAPLQNLGPNINTEYDEDAPFVSADGKKLYFSSKGHTSQGGYDVFKSDLKNGKWAVPENMGAPINTPGDEIYFITNDEGTAGYYSSSRGGGIGDMDIYRLTLECLGVPTTEIDGIVLTGGDKQAPISASIIVTDQETGDTAGVYQSDPLTGRYTMNLKPKRSYDLQISAPNYLPHHGSFDIPNQCEIYTLYQEINIVNVKDGDDKVVAQKAEIKGVYFNMKEAVLAVKDEQQLAIEEQELEKLTTDSLYKMYQEVSAKTTEPDPEFVEVAVSDTVILNESPEATQVRLISQYQELVRNADIKYRAKKYDEAKAEYQAALEIMNKDDYPTDQIDAINRELASIEQQNHALLALINEADRDFNNQQYPEAREKYSRALAKDEKSQYLQKRLAQIDEIEEMNARNMDGAQVDSAYNNLIIAGDIKMKLKDWEGARMDYMKALKVRDQEEYPISKLDEINREITLAESEDAKVAELIATADENYQNENYDQAKESYQKALALQPSSFYLQNRLDKIQEIETGPVATTPEAEFNNHIAAGDAKMKARDWEGAKIDYDKALKVKSNSGYAQEQIAKADREINLKSLIEDADKELDAGNLEIAKAKYNEALVLDPESGYIKNRMVEIREKEFVAVQNDPEQSNYEELIAAGDAKMKSKDWEGAKADYNKALKVKSSENYPQQQIARADREINIAELTEEGDKELKDGDLEMAKVKFNEALALDPGSTYLKDRLTEIQQRESEVVNVDTKQDEYASLIAAGDAKMKAKDWEGAKVEYDKALRVKTDESYPQEQIVKAEREMTLARVGDPQMKQLIEDGDKELESGNLNVAKAKYNEALALDPGSDYLKNRLTEIQERESVVVDADPKQDDYASLIAAGDAKMKAKDWEGAKVEYDKALRVKTDESYPQEQIVKAEREMTLARVGDPQMKQLIEDGDKELESGNLNVAKAKYNEALALDPGSDYLKNRLTEIQERESVVVDANPKQDEYTSLIAAGDAKMKAKDWEGAKVEYDKALRVKTDESYPQEQIVKAEREMTLARVGDPQMKQLIEDGDREFDGGNLDIAKAKYNEALALDPGSDYLKNRLTEIQERSSTPVTPEMTEYEKMLAKGAERVEAKDWEGAREAYRAAGQLEPGEQAPKEQLAQIDQLEYNSILAAGDKKLKFDDLDAAEKEYQKALAKRPNDPAAQEKLDGIVDLRYQKLLAEGDKKLKLNNYEAAKKDYKAAQALKPSDNRANDKFTELYNQQYQELISKADKKLKLNKLEEARTDYQAALALKGRETYPQDKIDEINQRLGSKPSTGGEMMVFKNIQFDFDKTNLRQASIDELDKIYTYMNSNPEKNLEVAGHTDWIGTDEYNMGLSKRRALSAVNYLKNKGLENARLDYVYFGESKPIADNAKPDGKDNPEGRQINRRCEFQMTSPQTSQNIVLKF